MSSSPITAAVMKDPEYSRTAMVERRRWIVAMNNGRRRYTNSRAEAIAWCEEHGVPFVLAAPVRPRHQQAVAR